MKYQTVTETVNTGVPEEFLIRQTITKMIYEIPIDDLKTIFDIQITNKEIYEYPDYFPFTTVEATLYVNEKYENDYSEYARKMESNNSKDTQE